MVRYPTGGSTLTNCNIKMLLHVFVNDINRIYYDNIIQPFGTISMVLILLELALHVADK